MTGGSAYIFNYDGANWVEAKKLTATDPIGDSYFGSAVAISDGIIIVGAPEQFINGKESGAVYTFSSQALYLLFGDLNQDGRIDLRDYVMFANGWLIDCKVDPSNPACVPIVK